MSPALAAASRRLGVTPAARDGAEGGLPALDLPGWPLAMVCYGYLAWWVVGAAWFVWAVVGILLLVLLVRHRGIQIPPPFWIWAFMLYFTVASLLTLEEHKYLVTWAYRSEGYFAGAVAFIYVYNMRRGTELTMRYLTGMWVTTVFGGILGVLDPSFRFVPPIARIASLGSFGTTITTVAFGSSDGLAGTLQIGRPSAPFIYANKWGAVLAITTPVAIAWVWKTFPKHRRWVVGGMLAVALVPIVYSLNRTLWTALAFSLVYLLLRLIRRRAIGTSIALLALLVAAGGVASVSFLGTVVTAKVQGTKSVDARSAVYSATIEYFKTSPFIGHAYSAGTDFGGQLLAASIGTQGTFWTLLYAGGLLSVVPFYLFMLVVLWRTRSASSTVASATRLAVIMPIGLSAFYAVTPDAIVLVLMAAAVLYREYTLTRPAERDPLPHRRRPGVRADGPVAAPIALSP